MISGAFIALIVWLAYKAKQAMDSKDYHVVALNFLCIGVAFSVMAFLWLSILKGVK